jgi:fido (protein-threonine AMPylation protein)
MGVVNNHAPTVLTQDSGTLTCGNAAGKQGFGLRIRFLPGFLDRLKRVHWHLFQDVYEWAGQVRTAPPFPAVMVKGGPSPESIAAGRYDADDQHPYRYFPAGDAMVEHLARWLGKLRGSAANYTAMTPEAFAAALAEPWNEVNAAHPFREGNTRAQLFFFAEFTAAQGHFLDFERFAQDEWFRAKFNAGRFLVRGDADTVLLTETLTRYRLRDGRQTARSREAPGRAMGALPRLRALSRSGPIGGPTTSNRSKT